MCQKTNNECWVLTFEVSTNVNEFSLKLYVEADSYRLWVNVVLEVKFSPTNRSLVLNMNLFQVMNLFDEGWWPQCNGRELLDHALEKELYISYKIILLPVSARDDYRICFINMINNIFSLSPMWHVLCMWSDSYTLTLTVWVDSTFFIFEICTCSQMWTWDAVLSRSQD